MTDKVAHGTLRLLDPNLIEEKGGYLFDFSIPRESPFTSSSNGEYFWVFFWIACDQVCNSCAGWCYRKVFEP